jgi:DNA replication protein DnaC
MNETTMPTSPLTLESLRTRLTHLGLYGLLAQAENVINEPWLPELLAWEQDERDRRSLNRRFQQARLRKFKSFVDFDWQWPTHCDRELIEELFSMNFIEEAANIVLIGPNGLGKTMIAKNLLHQAILRGHTARFVRADDMLADLAKQDSSTALARRLRRYVSPTILGIDEVGYLSYDSRYADLLFEVVTRRYQEGPMVLTTNKPFGEWNQVFPNAACVVTLIDRLVHRAEIAVFEGKSYRLKEAEERATRKAAERAARKALRATTKSDPLHPSH